MKKTFNLVQAILLVAIMVSCGNDEDDNAVNLPSAQNFAEINNAAYNNLIQEFTGNANNPIIAFTSANGVEVTMYSSCLTKNGMPVTGTIAIEFVEIFNRGNMLTTNKPTMGNSGGGTQSLLVSGGEIFIKATQNGVALETTCGYQLSVPVSLTGGADSNMDSFTGTISAAGDIIWDAIDLEFWTGNGQQQPGGTIFYNALVNDFGWFNCDKFASFTGPMTSVEVTVPSGYTQENSNMFIALQGEPNTLGTLTGQYPVGITCHLIFVTADAQGNWRYAIKTTVLTANASAAFTEGDLQTVTEAQLIALINALP